jgi:hypothetical protein
MTTTEQTPSALDSYLHYSEPFMPTEADDAELRALVEQAHTEAAALTRDELVGWVKRAEREKKASKETSLSRAQINLAGVLVHLAGAERAAELSTKHMNDERVRTRARPSPRATRPRRAPSAATTAPPPAPPWSRRSRAPTAGCSSAAPTAR